MEIFNWCLCMIRICWWLFACETSWYVSLFSQTQKLSPILLFSCRVINPSTSSTLTMSLGILKISNKQWSSVISRALQFPLSIKFTIGIRPLYFCNFSQCMHAPKWAYRPLWRFFVNKIPVLMKKKEV